MFPAKLKALNEDDSSDESETEDRNPIVTKEVQEEQAQAKYNSALLLIKENKLEEAEDCLIDLLLTDVMLKDNDKVTYSSGQLQSPLPHLKYCCFMNLGNIKVKEEKYKDALNYFLEAAKVDETDFNLWYRIGNTALKITNLNVAVRAFMKALTCSPSHWPCLNSLITSLYAVEDYLGCLKYISEALARNQCYTKGIAIRDQILSKHPQVKEIFAAYYPNSDLRFDLVEYDKNLINEVNNEVKVLRKQDKDLRHRLYQESVAPIVGLLEPISSFTWVSLGKSLLKLYKFISLYYSNIAVTGIVHLDTIMPIMYKRWAIESPECDVAQFLIKVLQEEEIEDADLPELLDSDKEELQKNGNHCRRRRSSPTLAEQLRICDKRRSARTRTAVKNTEQSLSKVLKNVLPHSLVPPESRSDFIEFSKWQEDALDVVDICRLFESQEVLANSAVPSHPVRTLTEADRKKIMKSDGYFGEDKEIQDVKEFVEVKRNENLLEIIYSFIAYLSRKWDIVWPVGLAEVFMNMYKIMFKHGVLTERINIFHEMKSDKRISEDRNLLLTYYTKILEEVHISLAYAELLLDDWFENRIEDAMENYSLLENDFSGLLLGDLIEICDLPYIIRDKRIRPRAYWFRTLFLVQQRTFLSASASLQELLEIIDSEFELKLVNIRHFYTVNAVWIKRFLNTLQRYEWMKMVPHLFLSQQYECVIKIFKDILNPEDPNDAFLLPEQMTLPRYKMYSLLLESLRELESDDNFKKEFVKWCELACYEAFATYRRCSLEESDNETKVEWASLTINIFRGLLVCLEDYGHTLLSALSDANLTRLVQTVTSLVCHQIESTDHIPQINADIVTPWLILYHTVDYEEKKNNKMVDTSSVSKALSVLFLAHEHLGKKHWCCFDDGGLLYYMLDVIQPLYEECTPESELYYALEQHIDQIFYCLYAHASKRNRTRSLQEHSTLGLALTWIRAIQWYQFYKPKELPCYDAVSKTNTITSDTENLFKRIIALIPPQQDPSRLMNSLMRYVNGELEELPENDNPLPKEIMDIFYLTADFYFKNKIWGKALRFYMLDVCTNPSRIDSWAAMALARGGQLEMKINSCETIANESDIIKRADMTCRCYKTALMLDSTQSSLWIEYGVFAYSIHAFCSRLLKQEATNISMQMFDMVETHKEQFLQTAYECFTYANQLWEELSSNDAEIQDERWLHHYLLGKIAEKRDKKPGVYLQHYLTALELLHNNGAQYPARITYAAPQHYAVEALEVYYRIHATILKMLEVNEDRCLCNEIVEILRDVMNTLETSQFACSNSNSDKNIKIKGDKRSTQQKNEEEVKEVLNELITKVISSVTTEKLTNKRRLHNDEGKLAQANYKKIKTEPQVDTAMVSCQVEGSDEEDCVIIEDPPEDPLTIEAEVQVTKEQEPSTSEKVSVIKECSVAADQSCEDTKKNVESTSSSSVSSETLSSSDTSSESDSGSESESTSTSEDEKDNDGKEMKIQNSESKERRYIIESQRELTKQCLSALEDCAQRFPEHYKSFYRLANHYFRSKRDRNIQMARQLMLSSGGLFGIRNMSNFFNGVWRIPVGEVDRPGSFAYHMARCVHLVIDLARDTKDYKLLMTLCVQLKDTPEPDKKYVRDNEREQFAKEVISVCSHVLRKRIEDISEQTNTADVRKLMLDIYRCYLRICKHHSENETTYAKLLCSAYRKYLRTSEKPSVEQVLQYCKNLAASADANNSTNQPKTQTTSDILQVQKILEAAEQSSTTSGATGYIDLSKTSSSYDTLKKSTMKSPALKNPVKEQAKWKDDEKEKKIKLSYSPLQPLTHVSLPSSTTAQNSRGIGAKSQFVELISFHSVTSPKMTETLHVGSLVLSTKSESEAMTSGLGTSAVGSKLVVSDSEKVESSKIAHTSVPNLGESIDIKLVSVSASKPLITSTPKPSVSITAQPLSGSMPPPKTTAVPKSIAALKKERSKLIITPVARSAPSVLHQKLVSKQTSIQKTPGDMTKIPEKLSMNPGLSISPVRPYPVRLSVAARNSFSISRIRGPSSGLPKRPFSPPVTNYRYGASNIEQPRLRYTALVQKTRGNLPESLKSLSSDIQIIAGSAQGKGYSNKNITSSEVSVRPVTDKTDKSG